MSDTTFVKLLDKEYQVACPPDQADALHRAAHSLDQKMREIRSGGSIIGLERIAVMAALNLSFELQQVEQKLSLTEQDDELLTKLSNRVSEALAKL